MKIFAASQLNKFKLEITDKIHCIVLLKYRFSSGSNQKVFQLYVKFIFLSLKKLHLIIFCNTHFFPQGYSTVLRSLTSGTATFTLELANYHPMSLYEQNALLNKRTGLA